MTISLLSYHLLTVTVLVKSPAGVTALLDEAVTLPEVAGPDATTKCPVVLEVSTWELLDEMTTFAGGGM
jgi:hypothetical protein